MNNKLEISLDDIVKQLKDNDSKYSTVQDVLDEIYGMGLSAANITSLLTGGFTIPDLFKDFKPSNFLNKFMPKKYLNVSKEDASINKYEKLAISNLSILLVSFNQAIQQNHKEISEALSQIKIQNVTKKDEEFLLEEIKKFSQDNYLKLQKTKCTLPNIFNTESIDNYIEIMMSSLNILFEMSTSSKHNEISLKLEESIKKYYYVNLLEITSEFPEVKLWIDLKFQKEILKENKTVLKLLNEIKQYQNKEFTNQFSLTELDDLLLNNSDTTLLKLKDILKDSTTLKHIEAHHNFIKATINEELLEENDIKDLYLPTRKEIYIPQSYKYFYYQETTHKKNYLDNGSWSNISHKEDEDIGKELFHALRNPHNMNQPIIILGHPGAGKSMFSSQFASKLINNNEFVPFLIKLRGVDSGITDIDAHINKGIQNSISGKPIINWTDWAREFPDKIPVIILDGFDELLRASQTQLNDYVIQIQKLQKIAQNSNLNIRVILTSRLTIMQDVKIPENSLIIKLNSFDEKRKKLWVNKWNEKQKKDKQFNLPNREDINDLSKEPLLLFLLAIYDFENNALSRIAKEGLNKSSLYDKLFSEFTKRQLRKDSSYNNVDEAKQKEMEEMFRIRIGFFAQMLFLHDRVHHYESDFNEELKELNIYCEQHKAKNILDGFFFVHKDKSTDGHENENLSFEFLHKTFGEFLAADFMLRIARFRANDDEDNLSNIEYFRQIFSYQWIYKQPKILEFLFEYSNNIFDSHQSKLLIKFIKKELKILVDNSSAMILPKSLDKLKVFEKLKHTAIYSQNLLLLWIAMEEKEFIFSLSKTNELNSVQSWKVFVDLWKNYGSYDYVSYLKKFITLDIIDTECLIIKSSSSSERFSDFSNYANISCNDDEMILSYYESNFIMSDLTKLHNKKNERLFSKISNLIITRLDYIYSIDRDYFNNNSFWFLWKDVNSSNKIKLFDFFTNRNLQFDKRRAVKELFNLSRQGERDLSPSEQLRFIELFLEVEERPKYVRDMLRDLYENFRHRGHEKYGKRDLSLSEQLRFIELFLEVEYEPNVTRDILRDLYENFIHRGHEKYGKRNLSPSEQLRFIELFLEVEDEPNVAKGMLRDLYEDFRHRGHEKYGKRDLSPSEQLRFIELFLEVEDEPSVVRDILRDVYENFRHRRYEKYERRSLSLSEQLRFIELFLEVEDEPNVARDMLRDLYQDFRHRRDEKYGRKDLSLSEQLRFIELFLEVEDEPNVARDILRDMLEKIPKYRNGYLSKKIRQLEQRI